MAPGTGRDLRPVATAGSVALVSLGLLLLAARRGWLGTDVGRGSGFCEAARGGLVRQPANSWSNLGFVAAGLAVGWRAGDPRGRIAAHPRLGTAYAVVVVLLGPASMAMHATQSAAGGELDTLSMYLLAAFASSYAVTRWLRRGGAFFAASLVAVLIVCELVARLPVSVPVVSSPGNAAFGCFLIVALVGEAVLRRRAPAGAGGAWGHAAVGTLLLAFGVWSVSKRGGLLCRPDSLLQGHAVWHLLCAVAAYFLYRHYASEPADGSATVGTHS